MNIASDSLSYPLRGSGKYLLLIGAIMSLMQQIVSLVPVIGLIAFLILFGYFCSVYFEIIQSTATGSDEAPQFPNVSDLLDDIIMPIVHVVFAGLVSFAPLIVYYAIHKGDSEGMTESSVLVLICVAVAYFPMAMLAVAVLGGVGGALPHRVVPSIFRAGWLYIVVVLMLIALYFLGGMLREFVLSIPYAGIPLFFVLGMYLMMANGRMLGLLYRNREERLAWI